MANSTNTPSFSVRYRGATPPWTQTFLSRIPPHFHSNLPLQQCTIRTRPLELANFQPANVGRSTLTLPSPFLVHLHNGLSGALGLLMLTNFIECPHRRGPIKRSRHWDPILQEDPLKEQEPRAEEALPSNKSFSSRGGSYAPFPHPTWLI